MSPNTTPSAHSARAARLVPWPGLSASGVRVLDRCDSVTSVVVGATTERSFPGQNLEPSRCGGCSRQSLMGRFVEPVECKKQGYSGWPLGGNPSALDQLGLMRVAASSRKN